MSSHLIPIILFLNTLVLVFLAWYALTARRSAGSMAFIFLQTCAAIWSTGYAFELISKTLAVKLFFAKFQYFGIAFFPLAWLIFTHQYTGKYSFPLKRYWNIFLFMVPVIILAIVWTNEWHGQFWTRVTLPEPGTFPALQVRYGVGFWIFLAFGYLLQLSGFFVLLITLLQRKEGYTRWQLGLMLFAISLPWLLNSVYIFRNPVTPRMDLTPVSFGITGLITALNIFKFRMLGFLPIAYEAVVRQIGDVILILDSQQNLIEVNPAGEKLFQKSRSQIIGLPVTNVLGPAIKFPIHDGNQGVYQLNDNPPGYYDVQIRHLDGSLFYNHGWLVMLHDITLEKCQQMELQRSKESLERLVAERTESLKQVYSVLNDARRFSPSEPLSIESNPQDELRLVTARLQEVQEAERKALAAELHDRVGQNLTALGINLRLIQMMLANGMPDQAIDPLLDSVGLVNETTQQVRDLLSELRPPALDDFGLFAALQHFSQNVQRRTGIKIDCSGQNATRRLTPEVEIGLYRIAQEAVTNTVKHARANRVMIKLDNTGRTTTLAVQDNGIGFTMEEAKQKEQQHHYGLVTIYERARLINAETELISTPGHGTCVKVTVKELA